MGKGAGGCDDRPAFAINGAALVGEQPAIELSPYDQLLAHRQRHPGNALLMLGTPDNEGVSDRVRFRKMIKDLESNGEIVKTWEQDATNPTVVFNISKPVWNSLGRFKRYSSLTIKVMGKGQQQVDRMNLVQQTMQQHGFCVVITLSGDMSPAMYHSSHTGKGMNELQVFQAECTGAYTKDADDDIDLDDQATAKKLTTVLTDEAFEHLSLEDRTAWVTDSDIDIAEIIQWAEAGIDVPYYRDQWMSEGFDTATTKAWMKDAGWDEGGYSAAAEYRQAGIEPRVAYIMHEVGNEPADIALFKPATWQAIQEAYDGYLQANDARYYGSYADRNISRIIEEYTGDADNPLMERDLSWIAAGFEVWAYYGKQEPWDEWPGCTAAEAAAFQRAGYYEPPADKEVLKLTLEWQQVCNDLELDGPDIEGLHKYGVTPAQFQVARKVFENDHYAERAFLQGWKVTQMKQWAPILKEHPWRSTDIQEFMNNGATLEETSVLVNAGVSSEDYLAIRNVFSKEGE